MMNLIQLSDAIQNLPLDTVMKYANGLNPQVPAYVALGELNRRKMLEDAAKGAAATEPPTVKAEIENALLQQRPMANPAANPQMASPVAAQPMANPGAAPQGLVNLAAAQPQVNMGAAPTAMMADGGVTTLMPSGGIQGYPEDGEDPSNYPQRSSPLEMGSGGLSAIPMRGMFNAGSYAGGGIVAFDDNPDQPVSVDMPANNTPSANADRVSADEIFQQLIAAQIASNENPPLPIPGSETAAVTRSDAAPASKPPAAATTTPPKATAASSGLIPVIDKPENKTEEQIITERLARMKRFGVSEDPLAESKKLQAANYERQQAEVAQHPFDRLISSLAAVTKADPTKGLGATGAAYAEKSQEVLGLQRAYKDKIEDANIQYKTAVAKEEDARKRGDMKGVEDALAAQQKAQFDYGKYMNDYQNTISSRITAGAAASNAENQKALLPYLQKSYEASAKHHEMSGQAAIVNANANLLGKVEGQGTKEDQLMIRADNALSNRPEFKEAAKVIKDMPPGSPGYNAYNQYISDLRREEVSALRENRQPRYIEPPKITPEQKNIFSKNVPESAVYQSPAPMPGSGQPPKNDILPMPSAKTDAIVGKKYNLPNGKVGLWNGIDFVVLPK